MYVFFDHVACLLIFDDDTDFDTIAYVAGLTVSKSHSRESSLFKKMDVGHQLGVRGSDNGGCQYWVQHII